MLKKSLLLVFACLATIAANAQCVINATASYTPTTVCEGDTVRFSMSSNVVGVNYNWSGPFGYSETGANPTIDSIQISQKGTYVVITSKIGCASDTDSVVIQVNQPIIPTIVPDTPICSGDTLRIRLVNAGGGFEAITLAPDNSIDTTNTGTLIYPNALKHTHTGIYKYITTSSSGCVSDTLTFTIPSRAIPYQPDTPIAAAVTNPICKGDTLRLTGGSNSAVDRYYWEGPNGQNYNVKDVTVNGYNLTGKQMFLLRTDSNYCKSDPDTLIVDVLHTDPPKVAIAADPGFIVGTNVQVTFTANVQNEGFNNIYQWRKNGVNIPNAVNKTYQAVTTQTIQQGDILTVWVQTIPTCANIDTALSNPTSLNIKLDVKEVTTNNQLQLYPNPVKDILHVTGVTDERKLIVTNLVGQKVDLKSRMIVNKQTVKINTVSLQPGIYILRYGNKAMKFIKTD